MSAFFLPVAGALGSPLWVTILSPSVAESDKEEKAQRTVVPKEVTPALCSLMSNYGNVSGSDSEPEGKVEAAPWFLPWFILGSAASACSILSHF